MRSTHLDLVLVPYSNNWHANKLPTWKGALAIIDFSCSFKTKVSVNRYHVRLQTPLPRLSMYFCSLAFQFYSSLQTVLHSRVSSNPAALINSGCPLGLDMTHLHLLSEAFAYSVKRFFAEVRHLKLGSEQHSRKVSTEKTSTLGRASNRDMLQPLLVSVGHSLEKHPPLANVPTTVLLDFLLDFSPEL